jgi:hypothetical protein
MNKLCLVFPFPDVADPAISVDALALQNVVAIVAALDIHLSASGLRSLPRKLKIDHTASAYLVPLVLREPAENADLAFPDADRTTALVNLLRDKLDHLIEVIKSPESAVREGRYDGKPTEIANQIYAQLRCAEKVAAALRKRSSGQCTIALSGTPEPDRWQLKPKIPSTYKDALNRLRMMSKPAKMMTVRIKSVAKGPNGHVITDSEQLAYSKQKDVGKQLCSGKPGYYRATTRQHTLQVLQVHRAAAPDEIPQENRLLFGAEDG